MKMHRVDRTCNKTDYIYLSTDGKDTEGIADGSTALEVDTGKFFIYYKEQWYEL